MLRDPYQLHAVALLLPIFLVAVPHAREPLRLAVASAAFVAAQAAVSAMGSSSDSARRQAVVLTVRLLLAVTFIAVAQILTGASGLLSVVYLPVVALAAVSGLASAIVVAVSVIAAHLVAELIAGGVVEQVVFRALAFGSVVVIIAISTRFQVGRLQRAHDKLRVAVTGDRRRARQIAGVEAIGRILASTGPTQDALDQVVGRLAHELRYQYVSIYLAEGDVVRLGAQRGYAELIDVFDGESGIVGRVMRTRRPAFVPDVTADPDYWGLNPDVRSEICAPLLADGQFLGFLNIESTTVRLDVTDERAVVAIADRLAVALILGRERQQLAERAELFRHLHDFSEAINGTLEPEELHRAIVHSVSSVVPADVAALCTLERASGRYLLRAIEGAEVPLGVEVKSGEGMAGRAIRDRTLVVDDRFSATSYPASVRDLAANDDPTLAAAVPLIRDGVVIGVLTLVRTDVKHLFSELERAALAMLAEQASLAVANVFLHAEVAELAVRDPLTGLFNRRYLDPAMEQLFAQRTRLPEENRPPLVIIMFDLDRFSDLNNQYGHQAGDAVLRAFGGVLRSRMRTTDIVARFGGEEFAALLYRADLGDALRIAEEVREQIAATPILGPNGELLFATVSAGCALAGPDADTPEALLRAADVALYMAKRAGRDRVVAA